MAAAAVTLVPSAPTGQAAQEPNYLAYASCSPDGVSHTETTHVCQQGDRIRAVLRYSVRPVEYEVCLRLGEKTVCDRPKRLEPGTSGVTTMPSRGFVGLATVIWRVNSEPVAIWSIRFLKDPIVPKFRVDALIVSGSHKLFGLVVRGAQLPGSKIRAWRGCAGECPLPLRLRSKRNGIRRYRIESFSNATFSFGDVLYVLVNAPWRRHHGARLWGRLYRGKLVRDPAGGPQDTAIRQIGKLLCTPPNSDYRAGVSCDRVPD